MIFTNEYMYIPHYFNILISISVCLFIVGFPDYILKVFVIYVLCKVRNYISRPDGKKQLCVCMCPYNLLRLTASLVKIMNYLLQT
jgi:uncharacterized membrane-anchored protein YitT (DUF2179 family)